MPSACARRIAGFQRSAQSARNAGANVRTVGTAAGARFASASASSARAACRASSTVSASSAPSVRLTTEPLQRRCTIHVLRPFGRARSPSPGAALSHSTASRPSADAKARAPAMVIFVLFVMARSLPFVAVATGASRAPPVGNTQDTPGNGVGFGVRKVGGAALKRRAGYKPLSQRGFQRFADARRKCGLLRPAASGFTPHAPVPGTGDSSRAASTLDSTAPSPEGGSVRGEAAKSDLRRTSGGRLGAAGG